MVFWLQCSTIFQAKKPKLTFSFTIIIGYVTPIAFGNLAEHKQIVKQYIDQI